MDCLGLVPSNTPPMFKINSSALFLWGKLLALTCLLALVACGMERHGPDILLQGAGATFPYPLYSKWISEFGKQQPHIRIDYQSIGSGGGIKQLIERTVDFGATDVPMTDEQLRAAGAEILHIPMVIGPVIVIYNLAGAPSGLKLVPDVLSGIFLGEITKWGDPGLVSLNPDLTLPDSNIVVVHRFDGSGTTAIFADYLSKVSDHWASRVGRGASVNWPVGLGGEGNEGVAGLVKQSPGTIGYAEIAYSEQNQLSYGYIRNRSGEFVRPSIESVTAAADRASDRQPDDLRWSITDAEGKDSYPISGFTYILVIRDQPDLKKGRALAEFLWWVLHEGVRFIEPLSYAPLPPAVVMKTEAKLKSITHQGVPLLPE